jgi:hypothetical protein
VKTKTWSVGSTLIRVSAYISFIPSSQSAH